MIWNNITEGGKIMEGAVEVDQSFDSIRVSNLSAIVHINAEDSKTVTYKADENIVKYLDIKVNDGCLVITSTDMIASLDFQNKIEFFVGIKQPREISIIGNIIIKGTGEFTGEDLYMKLDGISQVDMDIHSQLTDLNTKGSSNLNLTGSTGFFAIKTAGICDMIADNFLADRVSIKNAGVSDIQLYAGDELEMTGAGVCQVTYRGNPKVSNKLMLGLIKVTQAVAKDGNL